MFRVSITHHQELFYEQFVRNACVASQYARFVGMRLMYFYTKFRMPSCSGSLVTGIRPKGNCVIHVAAILLFHILQGNYLNKVACFTKICCTYIISRPLFSGVVSLPPQMFECVLCSYYKHYHIKMCDVGYIPTA
jgi:hypothetical protein